MTIIYITHDLGVVANVADRVAVVYAGQRNRRGIGMVNEIFFDSWHPYCWALLSALPQLGVKGERLPAIDGTPPEPVQQGLRRRVRAPENRQALNIDFLEEPPLFDVTPTHQAKTWLMDPRAPQIKQPDTSPYRLSQQHLEEQEVAKVPHPHEDPNREVLIEAKDLRGDLRQRAQEVRRRRSRQLPDFPWRDVLLWWASPARAKPRSAARCCASTRSPAARCSTKVAESAAKSPRSSTLRPSATAR